MEGLLDFLFIERYKNKMSEKKICPICMHQMNFIFNAELLNKYNVEYFRCIECELVQTEKPYWLDEAYENAIAVSDTGLLQRNINLSAKMTVLLMLSCLRNYKFLDIAGGFGVFTRLMRDYGFNYFWHDEYCANIFAKGFEINEEVSLFKVLSAFEVLEHLVDPVSFINNNITNHGAEVLIISTELFRENQVPPKDWWYYSFPTGQHISFYSKRTLNKIAELLDMQFYEASGLYIFSRKKIKNIFLVKLLLRGRLPIILSLLYRIFFKGKTEEDSKYLLSKK